MTLRGAAGLIDAVPGGRIVVIGSLPPHGRDLDLAVRCRDVDRLDEALTSGGYLRRGHQYVRFDAGTAYMVELSVLEGWSLPPEQIDRLTDHARLLPGSRRLAQPAPAHVLLLLAAQCARSGSLSPARRERLETALREDPRAWNVAAGQAVAWHSSKALEFLRELAEGRSPSLQDRMSALAQPRRAGGAGWTRAHLSAGRRLVTRTHRRGAVVALSGIDGAGKSSHALALAAALEGLGEDPVIAWSRVRYDPLLAGIGGVVKKVLAPWVGSRSGTISLHEPPIHPADDDALRRGGAAVPPALDVLWACVSGGVDGYRHLRLSADAVLRGKVVICDRYTLDTHVHLAERFGSHPAAVRAALALDRFISPKPLRTFWLDASPETAYERKPGDVDLDRLRGHADLYRTFHSRHDAVVLDAHEPFDLLTASVACAVWRGLPRTKVAN